MKNKIKCKFCGYEWITASELIMICCPNCLKKNKNLKEAKNEKIHRLNK